MWWCMRKAMRYAGGACYSHPSTLQHTTTASHRLDSQRLVCINALHAPECTCGETQTGLFAYGKAFQESKGHSVKPGHNALLCARK